MTSFTRIEPDKTSTGKLERVKATRQMCVARRDQMLLERHKLNSFIRKPYWDLSESDWLAEHFSQQILAKDIKAILVQQLIPGQTAARIPLDADQLKTEQQKEAFLSLTTPVGLVQGFGTKFFANK